MDIEFEGFKELERALNRLPDKVKGRVMQRSVTGAIRLGRKEIKASAPRGEKRSAASEAYGQLYKNIKVGRARTREPNTKSAYVSTGKAFWGFFLEYGTRYIPANPWFSRAFERSTSAMLSELKKRVGAGIDKEFNKLK